MSSLFLFTEWMKSMERQTYRVIDLNELSIDLNSYDKGEYANIEYANIF